MFNAVIGASHLRRARTASRLIAVTGTVVALLAVATPALANGNGNGNGNAQGGPPGNNGTIKVDGMPFDTHPNNEPHVDCVFQIDFYGFDAGDLWADLTFEVHPPTGNGVILTDTVFIGEDDNSGGGSEAGLDAEAGNQQDADGTRFYDLSGALAAYEAHPQQGYHVRLTVNADGSQGADTKHKVFWVQPCAPETVGTPPTVDTGGGTGGVRGGTGRPSAGVSTGGGVIPDTATSVELGATTIVSLLGVLVLIGSLAWLGAAQLARSRSARR